MAALAINLDILVWRWRILTVLGHVSSYGEGDFRLERVPGGWRGSMNNQQSEDLILGIVDREVVIAGWLKDVETTTEKEEQLRARMLKKLAASHRRALRLHAERWQPQWTFCVWGTLDRLDAICVGSTRTGTSAYRRIRSASWRMVLLQCPTPEVMSWATEYMDLTPPQTALAEKLLNGLPITPKDRQGAMTAKKYSAMIACAERLGLHIATQ